MTEEKSLQGKKSRAKGQRFESKVRQNLEELGWIVSKWMNTVDYGKDKIAPCRPKFNPFTKSLMMNTAGFPDFVCFRRIDNKLNEETIDGAVIPNSEEINKNNEGFDVIGVEVKGNGYLDKIEKEMCIWLLEKKIFSRILIARKAKERSKKTNHLDDPNIEYIDFNVKYNKKI